MSAVAVAGQNLAPLNDPSRWLTSHAAKKVPLLVAARTGDLAEVARQVAAGADLDVQNHVRRPRVFCPGDVPGIHCHISCGGSTARRRCTSR